MSDISKDILSDVTVHMKYAKYLPEFNRRETFLEIATRNMEMHIKKYPYMEEQIRDVYERFVFTKKVLPSMRSMQFGGKPIEVAPNRVFNCSYCPVDSIYTFSEIMFLLLGGTGCGYSVQKQHVAKLPPIQKPGKRKRRFLIEDSIVGWADAIKVLMKSYTGFQKSTIVFDYSDIRAKGERLVTSGGKAPGPQPLKDAIHNVRKVLDSKNDGEYLTPLECHDIICYLADAVLAGGIRRAALISLFSKDDHEMISCKTGSWWELNPQRGRANNSAVLKRDTTTKEEFENIFEILKSSGSGEPGFYFTNDLDWGTNPCCEIGLRPYQFCNLTTIKADSIKDQDDFNDRAFAASFLGTLQAGYTDFHYLRPIWQEQTEKDALIGVSMTGIASSEVSKLDLTQAAGIVKNTNIWVSEMIGINPAARTTCVKPEGTASLVLGTSSGIHAWHDDYYIRRIRVGKNEAIYSYLKIHLPELVEDDTFNPTTQGVISIPQHAPKGSTTRSESVQAFLERINNVTENWVKPGHIDGENTHNVSATISVRENEWNYVRNWMWYNRDSYNGLSILPYDGGTYVQAPFETCTKEKYDELYKHLSEVNLENVVELEDNTNLKDQAACAGPLGCEIK